MERVVYANLGTPSTKVRAGPGRGFDNGVVSVGGRKIMILTVDPVSAIPALGMKRSAWMSVHLIASDHTASGVDPEFALFAFNFPEAMNRDAREEYVKGIGDECRNLGVTIAGGHTGSYPGGGFTVIGSGTMFGFAPHDGYVTPAMARAGDSIVMTKHAAIEATASMALSFPKYTAEKAGAPEARAAGEMIGLCTTVREARAARKVGLGAGGVTSMHDATEGGVLGALDEMAAASAKSFVVDSEKIPIPPDVAKVCEAFKIDPLASMGEGSLLLTCSPPRTEELARTLRRAGIQATEIGKVRRGEGLWLGGGPAKPRRFVQKSDAYWAAYDRALRLGLE